MRQKSRWIFSKKKVAICFKPKYCRSTKICAFFKIFCNDNTIQRPLFPWKDTENFHSCSNQKWIIGLLRKQGDKQTLTTFHNWPCSRLEISAEKGVNLKKRLTCKSLSPVRASLAFFLHLLRTLSLRRSLSESCGFSASSSSSSSPLKIHVKR